MKVYPSSVRGQFASEERDGSNEAATPTWRELCRFAVYFLTVVLVFEGTTALCGLVWPHNSGTAHLASLSALLVWMFLADWLKVFGERRPAFSGMRHSGILQFLSYFVLFAAGMMLLDKWQSQKVEMLGACIAGLIYALGMTWFSSQRQDPFATKGSVRHSE